MLHFNETHALLCCAMPCNVSCTCHCRRIWHTAWSLCQIRCAMEGFQAVGGAHNLCWQLGCAGPIQCRERQRPQSLPNMSMNESSDHRASSHEQAIAPQGEACDTDVTQDLQRIIVIATHASICDGTEIDRVHKKQLWVFKQLGKSSINRGFCSKQ